MYLPVKIRVQNFLPVLILAIFCARTVRADNGVDFVRDIPPIFRGHRDAAADPTKSGLGLELDPEAVKKYPGGEKLL